MDFVYLKTLVQVALLGSFSKAAVTLCVTQSAVSRRIKFLEDHYGRQLLDRNGTALKPTEAGTILVEKAQKVLAIEKEILESLLATGDSHRISLCCTAPFGVAYLPGIMKDFMLQHADTSDLRFVFEMPEEALEGLRKNIFNLAVLEHCVDLDLTGFSTYPLPDDEMVFVSAPQLGVTSPLVELDRLIRERLYCKKDDSCAKRFLDKSLQVIGRNSDEFKSTVFFDDIPVIIREVIAGDGITFVSRSIVVKQLEDGSLLAHHVNGLNHARRRTLVLNDPQNPDPMLRDFILGIYTAFHLTPPCLKPT